MRGEPAFLAVEDLLDEMLPMRDQVGGTYGWTEHSYPRISELLGNEWPETILMGLNQTVNPEEWVARMKTLIEKYKFARYYDDRIEDALVEIYRQQTTKEVI